MSSEGGPSTPSPVRSHVPRVSVGLPTYNAEKTIASSIDAILAQSMSDFELIISDNASTDGTWSIVQAYARRDSRIVALRQPVNIGANGNYSAVFRAARAGYFKWASSNDWCAETLIERCVALLDHEPGAVLVAPRTRLFADTIDHFSEYPHDVAFNQGTPSERLIAVTTRLPLNNVLNGVIRSEALRRTRLIDHFIGADIVLVGHLAMLGNIELIDEPLFYRRMDRETATQMMSAEAMHRHHYPATTWRALFPTWRVHAAWIGAVLSSDLPPAQTHRALAWVLKRAYWTAPALGRDIVEAATFAFRR